MARTAVPPPMTEAAGNPPRIVDAPLIPPTAEAGLVGVFKNRYLLRLLVQREISARYQSSFLGLIWSYINPLAQFAIFYFIMGKLVGLGDRTENFAIHVFAALVVVHFFTETFSAGTRSIVRNKPLVRKLALPREMFPVAAMLVSLYHVLPTLVILVVACVVTGWQPDPAGMLAFLLAMLIILILGTALALMFSAANVFFGDFGNVVAILTNVVRFAVPMIYPYTLVQDRFNGFEQLYLANPIADAVLLTQRAFWVGTTSDPERIARTELPPHLYERGAVAVVGALIVLALAQMVFRRLEDKIPERLN